jgi:hypothetical protein
LSCRFPVVRMAHRRLQSATTTTSSHSPHNKAAKTISPNIFQEKVDRTTQLHHELEELVQNHLQRAREEASRPVYEKVASFVSQNKREFMNITIAFIGTLFAYQIAGLRKYSQRLEKEINEKEETLQDAQALLRSLTEEEFIRTTVDTIKHEIQMRNSDKGGNTWGRRRSEPDHSELMATIVRQALVKRIGDAGLSADERRDRIMAKLQTAQDELLQQQLPTNFVTVESDVIEVLEKSTGEQVVKKRKFSI